MGEVMRTAGYRTIMVGSGTRRGFPSSVASIGISDSWAAARTIFWVTIRLRSMANPGGCPGKTSSSKSRAITVPSVIAGHWGTLPYKPCLRKHVRGRTVMKRTIALSVILTLFVATTLLSQEARRQAPRRPVQQRQSPYQQLFTLRGVEFTEDQQAEVEELRKKYTPQLMEIQRKHGSILTDEQRQAQREALQAAREAGKQGRVVSRGRRCSGQTDR